MLLLLFSEADQRLLRRCAAVRVCDRPVFEEILRRGLDDTMSFEELGALYFVERLPGTDLRYQLRSPAREEIFDSWWSRDGAPPEDVAATLPGELRQLSQDLARFYRTRGDDLEQLHHLAIVDEVGAIELLDRRFSAADAQFDLPQCFALLRTLEERPNALLGAGLQEALIVRRVRLATRTLWAQEYRETVPYIERKEPHSLLDNLLADASRWILNLHAPGGMGKSMFIRNVIARRCVPENIPCAKVDFDFVPHLSNVAAEPWRLLLHIAQQLTRQMRASPFEELLNRYGHFAAEADSRLIISPREFVPVGRSDAERAQLQADVLFSFTSALATVDRPIVLILDTLENLLHGHMDLQALFNLLADVHDRCPRVRVILAGRLDLAQPLPQAPGQTAAAPTTDFTARFSGQNFPVRLQGFDDDEARSYLEQKRGLAGDPRVAEMIRIARIEDGDHGRAGISPFKLALLADIVRVHPEITVEQFARYQDVDLAYLIERVVDRIHDDQVKWLVRYGVVPRLLTRAVVEGVLIPFMVQGMAGQSRQDDATLDPAVEPQLADPPFPVNPAASDAVVDAAQLWETLYRYTAEYSWVLEDERSGALRFHPDVIEPMRRLLRKHQAEGRRILPDLHLACAQYYQQQAQNDPNNRPQWLREAVYHQLQGDSATADALWLRLLADADAESAVALAEEAVRQPLFFDATVQEEAAVRLGAAVRAQAHFVLARWIVKAQVAPSPDDWAAVDQHLAALDALGGAAEELAPAGELAYLRSRLLLARRQPDQALALCQQALQRPASAGNEMELRLLVGQILQMQEQPGAAEQFSRAAALDHELQLGRHAEIMPGWIAALEAEERYEEAAQACQAWRDALAGSDDVEQIGESLLAHLRQVLALGQEQAAAGLAQQGLDAWLAASTGQLSALGPWPARLRAEILLAQQQPAAALRLLAREGGPAIKGRGPLARPFEVELRARSYAALVDPLRAKPAMDDLAVNIHDVQSEQGVAWRLAYARLNVDETGDLRQAEEYWRLAHENAPDDHSKVRCELLRIRLLARQGRADEARLAASRLAARTDLPRRPGLRLLVALEALIQQSEGASWHALTAAAQEVKPASRRLMLLAGELRRYAGQGAAPDSSALLALLPPVDGEGMDPALTSLRLAEVSAAAGREDQARRLLQEAEQRCRSPLQLTTLRQTYRANDRVGWDHDTLAGMTLEMLADPASGESPELAGLTLLEQAERVAGTLGDRARAGRLLEQAESLLKPTAALWNARLAALRARLAWLGDDRENATRYADQAVKGFLTVDDQVSAEALRRSLESDPASGYPDLSSLELLSWGAVMGDVDARGVAKSVQPPVTAPSGYDFPPQLGVRVSQEGRVWRVELAHSDGRRWQGETPLEADFAALLDSGRRELFSHRFVEAFERDWQAVTLQMGRHLFPPAARLLLTGNRQPLDIRLDIRSTSLQWLPWELLRLDEESLPLAVDERVSVLYRLNRLNRATELGDTQPGPVLVVQLTQAEDLLTTRGYEQTTGGALGRRYRRSGVACQELEQPGLDELREALTRLRPAVVHLVSNLVENGPQAALVFGSRRDIVLGESVAQSRYLPGAPQVTSAGELSAAMAGLEPSPLVILDVPAPPVPSERLRQLFLRNAFASEWAGATSAPPAAILGTGLGGDALQGDLAVQLIDLLRAAQPIGSIARALHAANGQSVPEGAVSIDSSGPDSAAQPAATSLPSAALFTDRPGQTFPITGGTQMNLVQQRGAELTYQKQVLRTELENWRERTQRGKKLEKHHTQVQAITAKLDDFLNRTPEPDPAAPEPFKDYERISRSLIAAHRMWAYFRSKLALRDVDWLAADLKCADELAWECYRPARERAAAAGAIPPKGLKEPPLVFFSNDASPFAQARHSVFEPERINEQGDVKRLDAALLLLPIPLIGVPWFQLNHLPMAVVVAHEVGHAVEHDFALVKPLEDAFAALPLDEERRAAWSSWRHELFADAYGVLSAGPAFVLALMHFLADDPASIQQERVEGPQWGRYPNRFLRMLVNFELLAQTGLADPALSDAWGDVYQFHLMEPFEADIPAVVATLLKTPWQSLGGLPLKEVISFSAADAARAQVLAGAILRGSTLPSGEPFRRLYAAATLAYYQDPAAYAVRNANRAVVDRILGAIPPGVRSAERTPAAAREAEIKAIYGQTGADLLDLFAD